MEGGDPDLHQDDGRLKAAILYIRPAYTEFVMPAQAGIAALNGGR